MTIASALIGVPLSTYTHTLTTIPVGVVPTRTIRDFEERLKPFAEEIAEQSAQYDKGVFDIYRHCHAFPDEFYGTCTFEELVKIRASTIISLSNSLESLFKNNLDYYLIEKIRSSMWRWGSGDVSREWNVLAEAYEGIRNFSFGLPEFDVTLNYTTGYHPRGWSTFDRDVYLDGTFGFMIHYRGVHVMTIGFAVARGGKLLITQVQLRKPKGNRFLYKLPMNRVAYAVMLMKQHFPTFKTYLIDGDSLLREYIASFEAGIVREREWRKPDLKLIAEWEQKLLFYRGEMAELIRTAYAGLKGEWMLSKKTHVEMNKLLFHRIVRA